MKILTKKMLAGRAFQRFAYPADMDEEKLNCTLFGHPEWTEPKWLAEHLKWLSEVYKYSKYNALRVWSPSLSYNLSAMIGGLRLVRSWQPQINSWLAKNCV